MGVAFSVAEANLDKAVKEIFAADDTVRAVGITQHQGEYGFRVIRNAAIVPQRGTVEALTLSSSPKLPLTIANVPITVVDALGDIQSLVKISVDTATSHETSTTVPEVGTVRPLVAGLQIENFDDDTRERTSGNLKPGFLIVGTLGCFVELADGNIALLSNNHVVAAENHGVLTTDQIYQPGSLSASSALKVAALSAFKPIVPSPVGVHPPSSLVVFNDIDAGIAALAPGQAFKQGYIATRGLIRPNAIAKANVNDSVFKVGRTTGLTRGKITSISTVVGPVPYKDGPSWFANSIEIEGDNGTMFSDHGDSGSAIVNDAGEIVGLLYAGNGQQTYACPIKEVFDFFNCTLV